MCWRSSEAWLPPCEGQKAAAINQAGGDVPLGEQSETYRSQSVVPCDPMFTACSTTVGSSHGRHWLAPFN